MPCPPQSLPETALPAVSAKTTEKRQSRSQGQRGESPSKEYPAPFALHWDKPLRQSPALGSAARWRRQDLLLPLTHIDLPGWDLRPGTEGTRQPQADEELVVAGRALAIASSTNCLNSLIFRQREARNPSKSLGQVMYNSLLQAGCKTTGWL